MLGLGRYLFEVPIYRLSPERHAAETHEAKVRSLSRIEYQKTENPDNYEFASRWFDSHDRYCWDFNEVVGYLRLYPMGSQIRGELWWMDAKHFRRGTKRKFRWLGKAFELTVSPAESNDEIASRVIDKVEAVAQMSPCEDRYVDVQCLRNAAPALDWRALLSLPAQGQAGSRSDVVAPQAVNLAPSRSDSSPAGRST